MASNVSNSLLCTFGSATIAISFDQHYQSWNIFDSHSRNVNGFSVSDGAASSILFTDIQSLVTFLVQNYNGLPFEITPVIIEISDVVRNSTDQTLGLKALSSQPLEFSNTDPACFAVNCVKDSASRKGNNFGKVDLIQEFVQCKKIVILHNRSKRQHNLTRILL